MNTTEGDASCTQSQRRAEAEGVRFPLLRKRGRRSEAEEYLEQAHDAGLVDVRAADLGAGGGAGRRGEQDERCGGRAASREGGGRGGGGLRGHEVRRRLEQGAEQLPERHSYVRRARSHEASQVFVASALSDE
jgi:hypothetical protein